MGASWEECLVMAKRLRASADAAEVEFLEYLYQCEQTDLWRPFAQTFVGAIESVCAGKRYLSYKQMRETHGIDAVRTVGIHAVIQAAQLKTVGQQQEVLAQAKQYETINATTISEMAAERIRNDVRNQAVVARTGASTLTALARENERLRERVKAAEHESAVLRAENRELKRRLRALESARGTAERALRGKRKSRTQAHA